MALNALNVKPITNYGLNALVSVTGPIVNGVKVNRLLNQYQNGVDLATDNQGNYATDNQYNPVFASTPGKLAGQIAIFASFIQALELIKYAVYSQTDLQTAAGYTLQSRWGAFLNQPAFGLSDSAFRTLLFALIDEYSSKGTIPDLIQIFKLITNATSILLQESFPATFFITALGINPNISVNLMQSAIFNAKAGGVGCVAMIADSDPFVFQNDNGGDGFSGIGEWVPLLNETGSPILNEVGAFITVFIGGIQNTFGGELSGVL